MWPEADSEILSYLLILSMKFAKYMRLRDTHSANCLHYLIMQRINQLMTKQSVFKGQVVRIMRLDSLIGMVTVETPCFSQNALAPKAKESHANNHASDGSRQEGSHASSGPCRRRRNAMHKSCNPHNSPGMQTSHDVLTDHKLLPYEKEELIRTLPYLGFMLNEHRTIISVKFVPLYVVRFMQSCNGDYRVSSPAEGVI
ncbi:hypothetical protein VNO77_03782 [Canavalia gladiata]|uniref:Uncharacterized protein n=1 Tax=Canavalia gladiata TaxID=3824 RepID=A0AAN9MXD2_CANGL